MASFDTKVQDDNCLTKSFQCLTCFLVPLAVLLHPFRTFFLGCILVYVRRFCCKLWCLLCNCVCWKVRSFSSKSNSWPWLKHLTVLDLNQYDDYEFPANELSIGKGDHSKANLEWRRLDQVYASLFPNEAHVALFPDKIDCSQIGQGQVGDCWLMASIAAVAEQEVEQIFWRRVVYSVTTHFFPAGGVFFFTTPFCPALPILRVRSRSYLIIPNTTRAANTRFDSLTSPRVCGNGLILMTKFLATRTMEGRRTRSPRGAVSGCCCWKKLVRLVLFGLRMQNYLLSICIIKHIKLNM